MWQHINIDLEWCNIYFVAKILFNAIFYTLFLPSNAVTRPESQVKMLCHPSTMSTIRKTLTYINVIMRISDVLIVLSSYDGSKSCPTKKMSIFLNLVKFLGFLIWFWNLCKGGATLRFYFFILPWEQEFSNWDSIAATEFLLTQTLLDFMPLCIGLEYTRCPVKILK